MKTIHLFSSTARFAALVLILFLTAPGLQAQLPTAGLTPAQSNLLQMRLRALTNNPAGASARQTGATVPERLPAMPGLATPQPGATPAVANPVVPGMAPVAGAVSSTESSTEEKEVPGYTFTYNGVDVNQVLAVYSKMVGRTLLRASVPQASIVLQTESPLTKSEAIEALNAVLAMNGIVVVPVGNKFAKVLTPQDAGSGGGGLNNVSPDQLPDIGLYVTKIVQLRYVKPSVVVPIIQSFAKLNSLIPLDDNGILVMRDYSENIKRMMEMIDKIDVNAPAVYISEVIPIRYAQADDIAQALNSLGGQGGGTVSVGNSSPTPTVNGIAGNRGGGGFGGMGTTQPGVNPGTPFGQNPSGGITPNPNGTPSSATPFQRRLLNIINAAGGGTSGQQPIQIFGQAKIIADERSNSLLVFATKQDMDAIKRVIEQLDALLPQVLIESVVIDYSLGPNTVNYGVSAAQNPQTYSGAPVIGGGGVNNGQSLLSFLNNVTTGLTNASGSGNNTIFTGSALAGGLSYFGNIGPRWDLALSAVASDSHASIIQQPRILTQQAKPAQFFVGDTVPYVTSTYNYGGAYGNQSSYSQLSVGTELDVTPYINPDGLVVMQIQQEIDDLNGFTTISGVGQIPNTIERKLNSEIAVRDRDTVMLGGFIKNSKSTSRSGVPLLQDIPLLGNLFASHNNSKQREELIVLMRPTVLPTPYAAATNTIMEARRLPGVSQSYGEYVNEQNKVVDAERKMEKKNLQTMSGGFFNQTVPTNAPREEFPQPQVEEYPSAFQPGAPSAPAKNPAPPRP